MVESERRSGSSSPANQGGDAPASRITTAGAEPPTEVRRNDLALHANLVDLCRDVLSPLIRADGGEMYIVKMTSDDVHVHLAGTCAGCPGSALTRDAVITPAVRTILPKAHVTVTTGFRIPDGATKI